jgi:rhodanese-related sulfurtransferase
MMLGVKQHVIFMVRALLLAALPLLATAGEFQTPAITVTELLDRQAASANIIVVDVRDSGEYKSGHVPGAINIPHKKLERKLDKLRDADGIVLYCLNGKRTREAEQILLDNQVSDVFHLEGGVMGWRQQGQQLKTGWGP